MKGIILAGGNGTRLRPLTLTTNKHLLPIFDKQMILYPLQTLLDAGIDKVLVVSGGEHVGHFIELLGSGSKWGISITYAVQDEAGGIAQALGLARDFIGETINPFVVILGDNIYEEKLNIHTRLLAKVFLKKVPDSYRFGVAQFDNDRIEKIFEKPKNTGDGYAVTGCYVYYRDVFDIIDRLVPSSRGELEITDINNHYARLGSLDYDIVDGFWSDAGTLDSFAKSFIWANKNSKID